MKKFIAKALSPSFAVSVLALALTLGGGAGYALAGAQAPQVTVRCFNIAHFQNGWHGSTAANFHKPEVCKDSLGYVHLHGLLAGGTAFTSAFTLPRLDRPKFGHSWAVAAGLGGPTLEDIKVFVPGGVVFLDGAATDAVSLDGITFHVGG
jgi:hypothetical protein